jgi:hypothetical protein
MRSHDWTITAEHVSTQQHLLKLFNEHTALLSQILDGRKGEVDTSATEVQENCSETTLVQPDVHDGSQHSKKGSNSPSESTLLAQSDETSLYPRIYM